MNRWPDLRLLDDAGKDRLILALIDQAQKLTARVAELEARLGLPPKTPDNSGTPPSQGRKASGESAAKLKAKSHPGTSRALHPNPSRTRDERAIRCQHCGTDVQGASQEVCEAYDHIEIPRLAPEVTRVHLFAGRCPCCAGRFKAPAPADMPRGSPFGPNLKALAMHLRITQGIGFERLSLLFREVFGLAVSEGALVAVMAGARAPFAAQAAGIRAGLLAGNVLASDETGLRVGRKNWWLWLFHHADSAVFVAAPSRGKAVPEAFLAGHRPGYWLSGRYGGQTGFAARENQFCLAHFIRDAQFAIDAGDAVFAPRLRRLLGRACRLGRRRQSLSDAALKAYAARFEAELDRVMALAPSAPAGIKLKHVTRKIRRHLFVFVTNRELEAANNASERALRPAVTFGKITNGFRSEWGAKLYAGIRSVIETERRRAIGALDAIRLTLQGLPLSKPA